MYIDFFSSLFHVYNVSIPFSESDSFQLWKCSYRALLTEYSVIIEINS